jgi:hypothetical protein
MVDSSSHSAKVSAMSAENVLAADSCKCLLLFELGLSLEADSSSGEREASSVGFRLKARPMRRSSERRGSAASESALLTMLRIVISPV